MAEYTIAVTRKIGDKTVKIVNLDVETTLDKILYALTMFFAALTLKD
jgi:hypothetical protein